MDSALKEISKKLEKLDTIEKGVNKIQVQLEDITIRVRAVEDEQQVLWDKIELLEFQRDQDTNRARRKNLIFYGIKEDGRDSYKGCQEMLTGFLSDTIGFNLQSPFSIERAHRLGKKVNGKARPLIAKFCFFEEKETILSKRKMFKEKGFDVSNDQTKWVKDARRALFPMFIKAKDEGKNTVLKLYELSVDGKVWIYDRHSKSVKVKNGYEDESRGRSRNQSDKNSHMPGLRKHLSREKLRMSSRSGSRKRSERPKSTERKDGSGIKKFFRSTEEGSSQNYVDSYCDNIPQIDGCFDITK